MNKTVARVFLIFFVVGLSFFTIPYAHAQWVPTNGPTGGTVNSIVVKGTDLYAATTIGVFRSTDHGQSWTVISIMSGGVIALTISDNAIIAASGSAGFFRSTDNGETWSPDSAKIGDTYSTVALVADGENVTAQVDSKIYLSTDGGVSWTNYAPPLYPAHVFSPAGANLYAGNDYGVYVSTDHGASWTTIQLTEKAARSLVANGNNIVAGLDSGGINYSTDGGNTWKGSQVGTRGKDVIALYQFGKYTFAGTRGDGIFISGDNGATWSDEIPNMSGTAVLSFASIDTEVFAGLNGYGVVVTRDTCKTWSAVSNALNGMAINSIAAGNGGVYAGTTGGAVQRTNNNGATWTGVYGGMQDTNGYIPPVNVLADSGTMLYAGTATRGMYYSSNNGAGWHAINNGLPNKNIQAVVPKSIYILASPIGSGIYRAFNTTFQWNGSSSEIGGDFLYASALAIAGNSVFAGTAGGMMMTPDNGGNWSIVNNGFPCAACVTKPIIHALVGNGADVYVATDSGMFRSTNDGTSWFIANAGLEGQTVTSMAAASGDVFAGTASGGVFLSTDNGTSWAAINTGLKDMSVTALGVNKGYVYAGAIGMNSGSVVWQRQLSDFGIVGVDETHNGLPRDISLANYPNPFSSSTLISYILPEAQSVTLKVFNSLGEEIATLVNDKEGIGQHSVSFASKELPNGVYFYHLSAGQDVKSGTMLLLK